MNKSVRRWALGLALLSAGGAAGFALPWSHSVAAAPGDVRGVPESSVAGQPQAARGKTQVALGESQVASVEQLKSQAFQALRTGKFDESTALLGKAASLNPQDPLVKKMAGWTQAFDAQRQEFASERQKQYEKSVADVKLLRDKNKLDYAMDVAARAFGLAGDKKNFRMEPWVDDLVKTSIQHAEQYDKNEQWVKALRIYSDLGVIEPAQPLWKERLKLATRRVRLLALYTPEVLKKLQESESKEREEVEALLKPATQPATGPTTGPATQPGAKAGDDDSDTFRVDWRETLRGVRMDVLWDALVESRKNYYRDTNFKDLAIGGLKGVQAVLTTQGLEGAFPKLGDEVKRNAMLEVIEQRMAASKDATAATEQQVLRETLSTLRRVNADTVELPIEVLVSEFADGAFAELDPFTSMIWPSDLDEFRKTTQGSFSGVGIQIQSGEDGSLKVVSPLEDSPAYKAGVKAGDVITQINGKSAKGITINQAVKNITGKEGTTVTLTIKSPDGKSKDYTIRRETIHVASIKGWLHKPGGGWEWFVDPENRIAYMRLTNFTQDTSDELDRAIRQIKQAGGKALILDLRYNPGGLLTAATEVCDKFLPDGVIVSTHPDRETGNPGTVARAHKDDAEESDLPVVVLVNQYSASASEIVSGCLKDQKRALIVGERTFGKGSVQMLFPLADRSALLKLTTSHYYLPLGKCIHREENSTDWGVNPDVTVEMTPEQMRAAIEARQDLDILRDDPTPAEGRLPNLKQESSAVKEAVKNQDAAASDADPEATPIKKKGLLGSDPQLSAALLMLRLQLAGAKL